MGCLAVPGTLSALHEQRRHYRDKRGGCIARARPGAVTGCRERARERSWRLRWGGETASDVREIWGSRVGRAGDCRRAGAEGEESQRDFQLSGWVHSGLLSEMDTEGAAGCVHRVKDPPAPKPKPSLVCRACFQNWTHIWSMSSSGECLGVGRREVSLQWTCV